MAAIDHTGVDDARRKVSAALGEAGLLDACVAVPDGDAATIDSCKASSLAKHVPGTQRVNVLEGVTKMKRREFLGLAGAALISAPKISITQTPPSQLLRAKQVSHFSGLFRDHRIKDANGRLATAKAPNDSRQDPQPMYK
jgi:hypothetical protein